jgi:hypothetical protein
MWSAGIAIFRYVIIIMGRQAFTLEENHTYDPVSVLIDISH